MRAALARMALDRGRWSLKKPSPKPLARERRRLPVRRDLTTHARVVDMVAPHPLPKRRQRIVRTIKSMGFRSHRVAQKASPVWRRLLCSQVARRQLVVSTHGANQEEGRESTKRQPAKRFEPKVLRI